MTEEVVYIRQYKWQFWKTELKSPSLWPGIIKWAKNSVETDLPKGRHLTSAHLLTSPFYLPATQTTCSSLNTCSLTPPGLHTCCSSALQALSWTAYLENFFSSFKISKHPNTPLLLILADWSTPSNLYGNLYVSPLQHSSGRLHFFPFPH